MSQHRARRAEAGDVVLVIAARMSHTRTTTRVSAILARRRSRGRLDLGSRRAALADFGTANQHGPRFDPVVA